MGNKATVCLAMIVKNEAHIIKRCLDSAKPFIDYWVIVDTGSTDDTREIIEREMEGTPGQLIQEDWVDFGTNRTSLIHHAQVAADSFCDYLLLMDADHVLEAEADSFDNLTADSYLIELPDANMAYYMSYLVKASLPWKYVGSTHEFLACDGDFLQEKHPTISFQHWGDGGTRPEKIDRDRSLLERDYEQDPNNERTVFYLAQTYKDAGDSYGARTLYAQRAALGGWDEEVYWSLYQVAEIDRTLDSYLAAHMFRPGRPEAIHGAIKLCNERSWHSISRALVEGWRFTAKNDLLFLEGWKAEYGITFEWAIARWWTGDKDIAKSMFLSILNLTDDLPDAYRDSCLSNLEFC